MKAIETIYKGYRFRSRLEARWAVFLDACGADWEYEPEGFELEDGTKYLPDFLVHNVDGRCGGFGTDLYIEVKGVMTEADAKKINGFCRDGWMDDGSNKTPIYVVGAIPNGCTMEDIIWDMNDMCYEDFCGCYFYNFETVDGDHFGAFPGVNKDGRFELFGDDSNYIADMDKAKTLAAFFSARQARFEHGETPEVIHGRKV